MVGTLEDYREAMQRGVFDRTEGGKCIGCGDCCSNLLPVTESEIRTVKRYIKTHGIKEQKHDVLLANPAFDFTCPFLNNSKKDRCVIYPVRPRVCVSFICSNRGVMSEKEQERFKNASDNNFFPVDMRETFFGKEDV